VSPVKTPGVRRRLASVLTLLTGFLVLTGTLGLLSALLSYRAVENLSGTVQPAASSNAAILQALTDAETGVRAWSLSGDPGGLQPYSAAIERLPTDERALLRHLPDRPGLLTLVQRQKALADRWLTEYAEVRLGRPGGQDAFRRPLFLHGKELFDQIRVVHGQISTILDGEVSDAQAMAVKRVRRTGIGLAAFALLGAALALRSGRRLLRDIRDPLEHLESVVSRLAAGDPGARADESGPREIRLVARALNTLAEESERSQAAAESFAHDVRGLDTARTDFVSNVSHELRTPLTVLSGYLELVEDEFSGQVQDHHQRMIDASRRNVGRLTSLIDDLLTLSRAESRSTDLEQHDLGVLLAEAVDDLRMTATYRDVSIEKVLPPDVVPVLVDRGQFMRAIFNILGNAVKFSLPGGVVTVRLSTTVDHAVMSIEDRGIGIPAADLASVGTRFFRASNAIAGEVPGTGLGLRIVQSIVENHGGSLTLESVKDRGTTVTVQLPLHGTVDSR
jgi:signal transduction histidine kinase